MVKNILPLLITGLLFGCSETSQQLPSYEVQAKSLVIEIPAAGELEAAESEDINSPGQQPMTIAWLAEEFKEVKKGELIAVFDGEQLSLDQRKEQLAMMLIEQDIQQKYGEKDKQEFEVASEKNLVSQEFDFAKSFNIDDLRIYSQLEIIDSMQNTEFLEAKDSFLDWKKQSVSEQSQSAVDVLSIRKKGHEAKHSLHKEALAKLEIRAPYDGLLVYRKNWRGEKPSIGQTIFPGGTIASLPNLTKLQAKVFVLDKEAIGIEQGQKVSFTLDAFPDREFIGAVEHVDAFSRTIKRSDPTKYYEVIVSLDQAANSMLVPGRKLTATIHVDEKLDTLLVPLQAIDNDDGNNFVYLKSGLSFEKQIVKIGKKSLHFVEITEGLKTGDVIALSEPKEQKHG